MVASAKLSNQPKNNNIILSAYVLNIEPVSTAKFPTYVSIIVWIEVGVLCQKEVLSAVFVLMASQGLGVSEKIQAIIGMH